MHIVDASALAKLVVQEKASEEVLTWMEQARNSGWPLAAPDLIAYEMGNVLRKHRPSEEPALLARTLETALAGIGMERPGFAAAFQAARDGLTFYDAAYLAMAVEKGGTLVTVDAGLAKAARKRGIPVKEF
ncbi:MAG TPA: type II toxin-antitoxin system VapC family toxin [Candidatus Thermoplasmatota archaeon]|nr:type II toxin-antitoxin system VapC family toxin [Candidatus Thermoplasmatota archaeon]